MPSTAKIVLSFVAFYLVVGVYNYSGTGEFITPFFLNYFVLVGVAIYSYFINLKEKFSTLLAIYALALIIIASTHSQPLTLLNRWLSISERSTIKSSDIHKIIAIIVFYGALFSIHIKAAQQHKNTKLFLSPIIFLLSGLVATLLNYNLPQAILLSIYLLSFILLSNQLNTRKYQTFSALNFQYILFLVIENMRYFTTEIN